MGFTEKGGLLIPENVTDATGDYVSAKQAAQHSYEASWFRELLKGVDQDLDLIFVKPGSVVFPHSPRFYIIRRSTTDHDQFWVIQDEQGDYCPPDERHFRRFMEGDQTRNPRIWETFRKEREARSARAKKVQAEVRREIREKLDERLKFIFEGPSMPVTAKAKAALEREPGK